MADEMVNTCGAVRKRRKKIWQIDSGYHCSVVGACLNRNDLRRIAGKTAFALNSGLSDFSVHHSLSTMATTRSDKARALQKILDSKHRLAIKRYSRCRDEQEIEQQWQGDIASKKGIAGAYWAIMTHPLCQDQLLSSVYGATHMLSYDIFTAYQRDEKRVEILTRQIRQQNEKTVKNEATSKQKSAILRQEITELKKDIAQRKRDRHLCLKLEKENEVLRKQLQSLKTGGDVESRALVVALTDEKTALLEEVQKSKQMVGVANGFHELSRERIKRLEARVLRLDQEKREIQEELNSLESMFSLGMGRGGECQKCSEKNLGNCSGKGLVGQTILYVGGRKNMVSHYRKMVEKYGGVFLHHDGGRESSRTILPGIVSGADIVLCPIDCVSHDACLCVKKMCKRSCKPFVLMRSSGLSSLARGLGEIVQ